MKKISVICFVLISNIQLSLCQTTIYSKTRDIFEMTANSNEYTPLKIDEQYPVFIEMNEELTRACINSVEGNRCYDIISIKNNELEGRWEFTIINSDHKKYIMVVDFVKYNVRIVGKFNDGFLMVRYNNILFK